VVVFVFYVSLKTKQDDCIMIVKYAKEILEMISLYTRCYIKKQAKKRNIDVPKDYLETLDGYCKIVESYGSTLKFGRGRGLRPHKINANAGFFKRSYILATPEWAARLVLNGSSDTQNAFLITLGHELTHKDGDFSDLKYDKSTKRFIAHTNEVHADFGAAQKVANSSRNILLKSIEYKSNYVKTHKDWLSWDSVNKSDSTHPCWLKRKEYVENYDFDENLIRKIATDTNCSNQEVITKVIKHFVSIILQ